MKKIMFFFLIATGINAQAQTIPVLKKIPVKKLPGNHQIPTNPDMLVTNLRLLSITKDEEANTYNLRISYTIKNNGEKSTEETDGGSGFNMLCYINRGVVMPMYLPHNGYMKSEPVSGVWNLATASVSVYENVAGESSLNKEQEFYIPISSYAGKKFYLVMGVDSWNTTKETDRRNNYSNIILVTPPND